MEHKKIEIHPDISMPNDPTVKTYKPLDGPSADPGAPPPIKIGGPAGGKPGGSVETGTGSSSDTGTSGSGTGDGQATSAT